MIKGERPPATGGNIEFVGKPRLSGGRFIEI
jgi:hypothetical protein